MLLLRPKEQSRPSFYEAWKKLWENTRNGIWLYNKTSLNTACINEKIHQTNLDSDSQCCYERNTADFSNGFNKINYKDEKKFKLLENENGKSKCKNNTNLGVKLFNTDQSFILAEGKKCFQCPQCKYATDRKNNLKRHLGTMHRDCGKVLQCCNSIFTSKAALRDHIFAVHKTGYRCHLCNRSFCRKALLKRHESGHDTDDKDKDSSKVNNNFEILNPMSTFKQMREAESKFQSSAVESIQHGSTNKYCAMPNQEESLLVKKVDNDLYRQNYNSFMHSQIYLRHINSASMHYNSAFHPSNNFTKAGYPTLSVGIPWDYFNINFVKNAFYQANGFFKNQLPTQDLSKFMTHTRKPHIANIRKKLLLNDRLSQTYSRGIKGDKIQLTSEAESILSNPAEDRRPKTPGRPLISDNRRICKNVYRCYVCKSEFDNQWMFNEHNHEFKNVS